MRKSSKLTYVLFLLSLLGFMSSCDKNEEVEPYYPNENNVDVHYYMKTANILEGQQIATIYNTENIERVEDLKLYTFGENEYVEVYLIGGRVLEYTNSQSGSNLYDFFMKNGLAIQELDYRKKSYRDQYDQIVLIGTSIKVVHETLDKEPK
ncbi:hypothetical protein [Flammeovirga sp. SubArs3]|uniref:hypothetical protein n=1 Tax=Flammeovirga sp. SubArs3 TaxID=2995316 RepID=UPI00248AF128|nr:hypothetical protein [Flammeovirga sp. SubArs3]